MKEYISNNHECIGKKRFWTILNTIWRNVGQILLTHGRSLVHGEGMFVAMFMQESDVSFFSQEDRHIRVLLSSCCIRYGSRRRGVHTIIHFDACFRGSCILYAGKWKSRPWRSAEHVSLTEDRGIPYAMIPGIDVTRQSVNDAGKSVIWDCAGQQEYSIYRLILEYFKIAK